MFRGKTIKTEDNLLFELYNLRKRSYGEEVYPKVTSIPKGMRITPDIDLLKIDRHANTTTGYEVKFLRKTDPYTPFYTGLGQACSYFGYGIDEVVLVLGCFNMDRTLIDEIENRLKVLCFNFQTLFLKGDITKPMFLLPKEEPPQKYLTLDINMIREDFGSLRNLLPKTNPIKIERISNAESGHEKQCLLRNEFEWSKRWLRNREKKA